MGAGAAELIVESQLNEERLLASLLRLLQDDERRIAMGQSARRLAYPRAVEEIGAMAVSLASTSATN